MTSEAEFRPPETPFSFAEAYWKHRHTLAEMKERILLFSRTANDPISLSLYQFAQLTAASLEFRPDLILELGRGAGNSTCLFTEVANRLGLGAGTVLSFDIHDHWQKYTVPKLRSQVSEEWFAPLSAFTQDLLFFDFHKALADANRILVFWDADGFDVAECVLGVILPELADRPHLVMMHDMSDLRYGAPGNLDYGNHGIWKRTEFDGPRLKLGFIDSAAEQAISIFDFSTRNHLPLHSADHDLHSAFATDQGRLSELKELLGEMHSLNGQWFYFSLNQVPGPFSFPKCKPPAQGFLAVEGRKTVDQVGRKSPPHHQAFNSFLPYRGTVPSGHEYDFLGTIIRPAFVGREGTGDLVPVAPTYPSPDGEYFEWIDLLESVILADPEYVLIELGAGIGRWAVRAAFACTQLKRKFRLIAVEAEPTHFQWMAAHFRENGVDPSVYRLIHAAVTDVPGEIPFYVEAPYGGPPEAWYGQFIAPPHDPVEELDRREYLGLPLRRHQSGCRSVAVPGIPLVSLLVNCPIVDLIDMDIQGHELSVLSNAVDDLDRRVKRLHIGTHSPEIEYGLRNLLGARGWSCVFDYAGGSTSDTPWGVITFQAGVQSWVNLRLKG